MSSVSSKINYAFKLRRRQSALLAQDTIDKQPVHGIINLWHYQRQKCRVRFQGGCLLPFPGREIFFFPPVKGGDAYGYISRAVSVLPSGNRHYWPDVHGHKKEVRPPSSLHWRSYFWTCRGQPPFGSATLYVYSMPLWPFCQADAGLFLPGFFVVPSHSSSLCCAARTACDLGISRCELPLKGLRPFEEAAAWVPLSHIN